MNAEFWAQFLAQLFATALGSAGALGTYLWLQRRDQRERRNIIKLENLQQIYEASLKLRHAIEQSETAVEQLVDSALENTAHELPDFSAIIQQYSRLSMLVRLNGPELSANDAAVDDGLSDYFTGASFEVIRASNTGEPDRVQISELRLAAENHVRRLTEATEGAHQGLA